MDLILPQEKREEETKENGQEDEKEKLVSDHRAQMLG